MSERAPELRLTVEQARRMLAEFEFPGPSPSLHPILAAHDALTAHALKREREAAEAEIERLRSVLNHSTSALRIERDLATAKLQDERQHHAAQSMTIIQAEFNAEWRMIRCVRAWAQSAAGWDKENESRHFRQIRYAIEEVIAAERSLRLAAEADRDRLRTEMEDAAAFAEDMRASTVTGEADPFADGKWRAADLIGKRIRAALQSAAPVSDQERDDG